MLRENEGKNRERNGGEEGKEERKEGKMEGREERRKRGREGGWKERKEGKKIETLIRKYFHPAPFQNGPEGKALRTPTRTYRMWVLTAPSG